MATEALLYEAFASMFPAHEHKDKQHNDDENSDSEEDPQNNGGDVSAFLNNFRLTVTFSCEDRP